MAFTKPLSGKRLAGLSSERLSIILDAYHELFPERVKDELHLFLDEVQVVPGWERFVARLFEDKRHRITVTGSSSRLLSKEIATSLRGRSVATHIYPLSFAELASYRGIRTGERETKGLLAALHAFDLAEGTIITADDDREETIDGKRVRTIPLWRWLLEAPVLP